jgi:predicted secreted protein
MPCPELIYAGALRPGKPREEYDTPGYRRHCKQIAVSTANQLAEFAKNNIVALAVLGIEASPSCGVGGFKDDTGILIEELMMELEKRELRIPAHAINASQITADVNWLENILRRV